MSLGLQRLLGLQQEVSGMMPKKVNREEKSSIFNNIIEPLDGFETAEAVLPVAQELCLGLSSRITIVRVIDSSGIASSVAPAVSDATGFTANLTALLETTIEAEEQGTVGYLEKVGVDLRAARLEVLIEVRQGDTGDELLNAIEVDQVDAVAIATHGRSGISRTIFGSVADRLIRESHKPVLVVKAK